MTVALLMLVAFMLLLAYGGVAGPAIVFGAMIIAFWVMVFRLLIGFGRWVTTGGQPCSRGWGGCDPPASSRPGRVCRNSRCGRMNVASARFCSQCGRALS